jgi:aminocarboxymuconate-semialdehyde decarboxylase
MEDASYVFVRIAVGSRSDRSRRCGRMTVIDTHAHVTPGRFKEAIRRDGSWHGLGPEAGELGLGGFDQSIETRLAEMDRMGVDEQLITPNVGFYQYLNELDVTKSIARECNDEIAEIILEHPGRFSGLGTLPMQDVASAIAEMERVVEVLGLEGVIINDHVAGRTYDEPEFLPFFRAAEELGAILFFHQGGGTLVNQRTNRYKLGNAVGNLTERILAFSALVFGGVVDRFPDLRLLLAHAGGYTAFGAPRLDKVAGALEPGGDGLHPPFGRSPDDLFVLLKAPSEYLRRFWYDCCTYSGPVLRFVIDAVGIDRVVLGTDYPAPMVLHDPVEWVRGLPELSGEEQEAILTVNPARLLAR